MKFWAGVTDNNWYTFLAKNGLDEVNFWRPAPGPYFKVKLVVLFGFTLQACRSPVPEQLTSDEVMAQLKIAYTLTDRGQLSEADSVYKSLLEHQVSAEDSLSISQSYIQVLIGLEDHQRALLHIDRAFPDGQLEPWNELRRHSYRQQVFMGLNDCPGIMAEQAALLALVETHQGLQLSLEEIVANGVVLSKRCP